LEQSRPLTNTWAQKGCKVISKGGYIVGTLATATFLTRGAHHAQKCSFILSGKITPKMVRDLQ